jgi:hypothetical protein
MSTILSSQYAYYASNLQLKIRGGLSYVVISKSLQLPMYIWTSIGISDSQTNNLLQVDVYKIAENCIYLQDLWSLPTLIIIACYLLYIQVYKYIIIYILYYIIYLYKYSYHLYH